MRRIQLVLAALAIVVTSFAAFAGPAMANDWHNHRNDNWNNWNNNWHNNWNNGEDDWNGWNRWNSWNGWNTWGEVQNCPFWGDTEGIVNQWDCFN